MAKYLSIESLLQQFEKFTILIIGDVMIDSYLWGSVSRISPEAPVPVVTCNKRENRLGGAANVALNIQSLGAKPILCSVIGDDDRGKIFLDLMQEQNLSDEGLIKDISRITTSKTRIISDYQHLLRVDQEITDPLSRTMEEILIRQVKYILEDTKIDAIIYQDYDKGVITPHVIEETVKMALQMKIPTLVDPKKRNFLEYKDITLFKPNFIELIEGLKIDIEKSDIKALQNAAKKLQKQSNIEFVLITLSELGVLIQDPHKCHTIQAEKRDIADVSGAGDTVISMASLCLAAELNAWEIAKLSNLAGGLVCEKVGVVPIQKEWIIEHGYKFAKDNE